ncbi:Calmodulin-binding transcription activator 2 [Zea mays]|uniref:Calmodulin-binding transcription activator 2 n=1 Tax=Zea mays TaxID=4577 RepID=A0A1D6JR84_MAIZE|nr:Calmodulin-binding transcription activator 2 [Zea mays]
MAEARRHAVAPQLVLGFGLELIACNTSDWVANPELLKSLARGFLYIEQILKEAQHRWLRPAEICEILKNYRNFHIAPEPPNRPPSGSLFLFDRKVLRYFRKDGHSWRKKKDGKTVKEAHERLKGFYAHCTCTLS